MSKRAVGGWSLVAGGMLFAIFWGTPALGLDVWWLLALAIHGVTIALLAIGLLIRQSMQRGSTMVRFAGWVGVAVSLAGLLALFPLIGLGFLIVGGTAAMTRSSPMGGTALTLGAAALLLAYALGARYGIEGATEPGVGIGAVYIIGLLLTAVGLVVIGLRQTGGEPTGLGRPTRGFSGS